MKTSKPRLLRSLLLLTLFVSSCALFVKPVQVKMEIPPRPALAVCSENPHVEGKVADGTVVLSIEDAVKLRDWAQAYEICMKANAAILGGHIEKLENRLKAIGG